MTNLRNQPKVAIFYDWLNQWGGAERVLLDILEIYPEADLFTLYYDPDKTKWLPQKIKVTASLAHKLPLSNHKLNLYAPVFDIILEQFDFSSYDIVISTTSLIGHCLITPPNTLFICYAHNINRFLYQNIKTHPMISPFLKYYHKIDSIYGQRPDFFITNSKTVQGRINNHYCRDSTIIYPGCDVDFFQPSPKLVSSDYFLIVSRLVPHKKIGLAITACHALNKKLVIIGEGRQRKQLEQLISNLNDPNIKILGLVSHTRLLDYYQKCQALICPQEEDFGLSPIEAMACGKPVIAYNRGGITETVINHKTGILFDHQSEKSLIDAINSFENFHFTSDSCRKQALKFSRQSFMLNFKQQIDKLWHQYQHQTTTTS